MHRASLPNESNATTSAARPIGDRAFHDIDQAKGKMVMICFWDMNQRPSRRNIRVLEEQKETLEGKNIAVLIVHSGMKSQKEVTEWLKRNSISLTTGIIEGDPYDILYAWGAKASPWLVLTDEQHITINEGFNINDLLTMK